jgi:cell division protein FtsW (lipid II flippase)
VLFLLAHAVCALHITGRETLLPALCLGVASSTISFGLLAHFVTRSNPDILYPLIFLYSVGWLELLRLRVNLAERQSLWLFVACGLAILAFRQLPRVSLLERHRTAVLLGGLALLFSALLVGTEVNGAKLWLRIGGLSFQPIEIVKILLVVTLASFWRRFRLWLRFSKGRATDKLPRRGMVFLAVGWFSGLAILVIQRDLGMALLLIGVFFTMFYVATGRRDLVVKGVGAFFAASIGAILFFHHIRIRIRAWWDPFLFHDTDGYQLVQGLYAIADGGPWGRGLFLGRPHIVPEAHTDFILTAISHELGWVMALCIVFCSAHLGSLFFRLAEDCKGEFRRLLLTGLASLWTLQCFIIIGGTTKVIPMTGLTLPFISYGGSSLVANALLIVLVVRCTQRRRALSE